MHLITILSLAFISFFPHRIDLMHGDHAIYLSVAEVEHKNSEKKAKIKIKVFTNDLEDVLMNAYHERISLDDASICEKNKIMIEGYFLKHFKYAINGISIALSFERCETNGDATWLHFNITCPPQWNKISVTADYLMELFPTQSNVVSIQHGNEKRFININKSKTSDVVTF